MMDRSCLALVPEVPLIRLGAGQWHSCGITAAGAPVCWGDDEYGQVSMPEGTFMAVAAGGETSCFLDGDGTARCWGNADALLGTPPSQPLSTIACGMCFQCGLTQGGDAVHCWGEDTVGQLSTPEL